MTTTSYYHMYGHVPWVEGVEKATNGRVKVTIYPSSTIMKSKDAWEGVKSGVADISWLFTGLVPGQFDMVEAVSLPFMVPSAEVGAYVTWNLFQKSPDVQKQFAAMKMLAIWCSEPGFYVSNKKVFKTLDDFKGMKVREVGGPPTELIKALGATPLLIGMPDVYLNLQKGVMDAAEVTSESYWGFRLFEVAPYVTLIPAIPKIHMLFMNKDTWNDMPKDVQDGIMSVSDEKGSVRYSVDVYERSRIDLPDLIKKSGSNVTFYTVPPDDVAKWVEVGGKPVWANWIKSMKAKGFANAQQVFDLTQQLADEYSKKITPSTPSPIKK
ncbi:MAG: TRAP transporter substrate-binding protein [Dehalococcoidia bacterium]|nr:TRAP transporter substrate-binding protein [Dehalococcoidia bacterium]